MPEFRPASSDCPDAVSYPLAKPARLLHMSRLDDADHRSECGCSSGVEHNLAKVGVEGSNPFARSKIRLDSKDIYAVRCCRRAVLHFSFSHPLATACSDASSQPTPL